MNIKDIKIRNIQYKKVPLTAEIYAAVFLSRYYIERKGNISLKFIKAKKLHSDNGSNKHRTAELVFIDFC